MISDKYSVYLVDDSPDDRLFLRKALERSSKIQIIGEATDGEEAIGHFSSATVLPAMILLDIKMPRKNGFEVLEWLRSRSFPGLKVAMVSGSWLADDVAKSKTLGACAYFKKTALRAEQDEMVRSLEQILAGETPCS